MGWRPEGYVLQVGHSLMERATLLMQRMLQEELEPDGLAVTVTPMRQFHTANSSSADLGTITLTSETLLTMDAAALRDRVDRVAAEAYRRMEEINAQEEALCADFLAALKKPRQ